MKVFLALFFLGLQCLGAETNSPASRNSPPHVGGSFVWLSAKNHYRGTNYVTAVRWTNLWDGPAWNTSERPPLSVEKATEIARLGLERQLQGVTSDFDHDGLKPWVLHSALMHRAGGWDFWFYELEMKPYLNASYNWDPVTVFVTMDGEMVPLHRE